MQRPGLPATPLILAMEYHGMMWVYENNHVNQYVVRMCLRVSVGGCLLHKKYPFFNCEGTGTVDDVALARSCEVCIITGFLGTGKTTLLNHILQNQQGAMVPVCCMYRKRPWTDANGRRSSCGRFCERVRQCGYWWWPHQMEGPNWRSKARSEVHHKSRVWSLSHGGCKGETCWEDRSHMFLLASCCFTAFCCCTIFLIRNWAETAKDVLFFILRVITLDNGCMCCEATWHKIWGETELLG